MRRAVTVAVFAVGLMTGNTAAEDQSELTRSGHLSGAALLEMCQIGLENFRAADEGHQLSPDQAADGTFCPAYVKGVADSMALHTPPSICIPKDTPMHASILAIIEWLVENPECHDDNASLCVWAAVLDKYPCEYQIDVPNWTG